MIQVYRRLGFNTRTECVLVSPAANRKGPHPIAHALHPEGISNDEYDGRVSELTPPSLCELSHGGRIKPLLDYCGKRVLPH